MYDIPRKSRSFSLWVPAASVLIAAYVGATFHFVFVDFLDAALKFPGTAAAPPSPWFLVGADVGLVGATLSVWVMRISLPLLGACLICWAIDNFRHQRKSL
jgi:hypothetical protein